MIRHLALAAVIAVALAEPASAQAREQPREQFIGGPLHQYGMQIFAKYRAGITIAPMPPGMAIAGPGIIHLEADLHATDDNAYGYVEGEWVGYVGIEYTLTKPGRDWKTSGRLLPMVAKDGPHYGANVTMDGPGPYHLAYRLSPPGANGLFRDTDPETGVPDWWQPFSVDFDFRYPGP